MGILPKCQTKVYFFPKSPKPARKWFLGDYRHLSALIVGKTAVFFLAETQYKNKSTVSVTVVRIPNTKKEKEKKSQEEEKVDLKYNSPLS